MDRKKLGPRVVPPEKIKKKPRLSRDEQAMYLPLVDQMMEERMPANPLEKSLVEEIAFHYVRLESARKSETDTLNKYAEAVQKRSPVSNAKALAIVFAEHGAKLERMQRKEIKIEDAWYRAITALDRAQSNRRKNDSLSTDPKTSRIHLVKRVK